MTAKTAAKADAYRLQRVTTPERLEMAFSTTLSYGEYTLVSGYYYRPNEGCYYAAIYKFTTADHTCEGNVELVTVSEKTFEDNGHAIAWAINQVK